MNIFIIIIFMFFTISKFEITPLFCFQNEHESCTEDCLCVWCVNGSSITNNCISWLKKDKCNFDTFDTFYGTDKCQNDSKNWKILILFISLTVIMIMLTILFIYILYEKKVVKEEECDLL